MHERATAAITTLIVDDEPLASSELGYLLKEFPEIEIVGTGTNGLEAIDLIDKLEPDLVFLDVQMPGLDGVGVIRKLRERGGSLPHFVFVTAYDQYAVEAFRLEATDYLLKPLEKERLAESIERARRTILRSFAGFGSAATNAQHATGFRANSNRSGTTPAHDWAHYPAHVRSFTERLRGVVIENRPAAEIIRQHDAPDALHYVDPPYPHSTRNMQRGNAAYACEMSDDDHRELARTLRDCLGVVVISGYPCELYDTELYPDWYRFERAHFADGARRRIEVLWVSPGAPLQQRGLWEASHELD